MGKCTFYNQKYNLSIAIQREEREIQIAKADARVLEINKIGDNINRNPKVEINMISNINSLQSSGIL